MIKKIENRFLANYILLFILSILVALISLAVLGFANDIISKNLVKNNYTAKSIMKDNYNDIDASQVVKNGGGVQVINTDYEIVYSAGINSISKDKLTTKEFTDFLIKSNSAHIPFSYNIEFNSKKQFWLVVTFPTSIRIDFVFVQNKEYASVDKQGVVSLIIAIIMFYLLLLGILTFIYSKITSISVTNPLRKLSNSVKRFKDGDYSSRVNLNLKNEFGQLETIYNEMARKIESEISLRRELEENRKSLVLNISHDLKNPLASIMGYAEICKDKKDLSIDEINKYSKIIYDNSIRANNLIVDLFELSKMESSEYEIHKTETDICENIREEIVNFVSIFDKAGFTYEFDIPEKEIFVMIDKVQMNRVFQNLVDNTVKYNAIETKVQINLIEYKDEINIVFKDNGIGIPKEIAEDIFNPFVRSDSARNSKTGGTGLGLAIVKKIVTLHGGNISLITDLGCGCEFIIKIPKI